MADEGIGGAPPASVPIPAEDAPRPETGPEERLEEEPTEDVPEEEVAPDLAAPVEEG